MEFKLLIIEADGGNTFHVINPEYVNPEVLPKLSQRSKEVQEHTFVLKYPMNYGVEMQKNSLKQTIAPNGSGFIVEESREKPATIATYLRSWTLKKKIQDDGPQLVNEGNPRDLNYDEVISLNTLLVDSLYNVIINKAKGGVEDWTRFFPQLSNNGSSSQEEGSA